MRRSHLNQTGATQSPRFPAYMANGRARHASAERASSTIARFFASVKESKPRKSHSCGKAHARSLTHGDPYPLGPRHRSLGSGRREFPV